MPKEVEECVRSVLDDNPEYDESRAYAICNSMKNKGQLKDADIESCPQGQVKINGNCVSIEEVEDVPPSALDMSEPRIFQLASLDTKPIERVEENGKVRYKNLKLLSPGVWTDAGSKETIYYSPEGISNLEMADSNVVNVMHDVDNDVSAVGEVDPKSLEADESGHLYGDVVLHMNNAASQYADENLQKALESQGTKGFGGPSVEIDAEGQVVEWNEEKEMHELKAGRLSGVGFVASPASKPVSFARQTASREVALADGSGDNAKGLYLKDGGMSERTLMDMTEEEAQDLADALGVSVDELMNAMQAVGGDDGEEEEEMADDEEDEEGEEEMGDYEEEDEEDEEKDMQGEAMQVVQEQIDDIWNAIEELKEESMSGEEMSEELEEAKGELADAETVQQLRDAKDELDKRLSKLEDEPKKPKTLADDSDDDDWYNADGMVSFDANSLR